MTHPTQRPAPVAGLLSLVIPVFNEQESLETLAREIDIATRTAGLSMELVFVDDGSTDASWPTIQKLAAADTRIHGLRFRRNFGKAAALEAGFRRATGDIIMTLDADLQDDPAEIPHFLQALAAGQDVVSGHKKVRRDPIYKVVPSRVFNWLVSVVTGVKLHDHNCGFKAYRAAVIREVRLYGELHRFIPVLAAARGFRVGEIIVNHRPRKFGQSKFGFRRYLRGFLDLLQVKFQVAFSWRPMHFFGSLGVLGFLSGGLTAGLIAANWLLRGLVDPQWGAGLFTQTIAAAASLALMMLGGQALLLGFLGEWLAARRTDDPYAISDQA